MSSIIPKIPGAVLLGFADWFEGGDVDSIPGDVSVGAGSKSRKPAATATRGRVPVAKPVTKGKVSPHKTALVSTTTAGKAALKVSTQAHSAVKAYKPAQHAPLVPVAVTAIHGNGQVILGATPRTLTPKQRAAVNRHVGAIARGVAANKRLNIAAAKAHDAGTAALKFVQGAAPFLKKALGGGRVASTRIHGHIVEAAIGMLEEGSLDQLSDVELGALCSVLGMLGVDAAGLSPGQPGYDPTTDPDAGAAPSGGGGGAAGGAAGSGGGLDPSSGIVTAPDGSVLYDPAQDPGIVPMPARDGKLSDAEAQQSWLNVPDDGIVYGDALPDGAVGSYNWFKTPSHVAEDGILKSDGNASGFIYTRRGTQFGSNQGTPRWMGQDNDDQVHDVNDDGSIKDLGVGAALARGLVPFLAFKDLAAAVSGGGDGALVTISAASIAHGWGPLNGNPNDPRFAGLQCAIKDGKWFWQGKNAPAAAAYEADHKIEEANLKTVAANTATALARSALLAKDAADAAEAQAKQDAQNALAESAAQSQANVAQTQAQAAQVTQQAQQGQIDVDTQRAQLDAQQAELAAAKEQAQIEAQAQHALIDQAQVWNQWAQAHPDEAVAQMQQDAGGGDGGGDGGGGGGGGPDYPPPDYPPPDGPPPDGAPGDDATYEDGQ